MFVYLAKNLLLTATNTSDNNNLLPSFTKLMQECDYHHRKQLKKRNPMEASKAKLGKCTLSTWRFG